MPFNNRNSDDSEIMDKVKKGKSKIIGIVLMVIILLVGLIGGSSLVETVDKGEYQVKQAAITGTMSAKMTPGMWAQMFGDIESWPKAETFFFTHGNDAAGDVDRDTSMEVRFNDGSICNISGTLRIIMPTSEDLAISMVTERGHKTYGDVREKLIQPHVRNVLRSTANLMSAKESYASKRPQYISWARDQIQNGVYQTKSEVRPVKDLVSGEIVNKEFQVIKKVEGKPLYQKNPIEGTGILVKNFEVKQFRYDPKVQKQIATQQEALMAVQTAKAKAEEAEQDKLTIVAQGKAKVAKAKYEKEQEKVKAVVDAQKDKEVAELDAARDKEVAVIAGTKRKEVAALDRDAAKLTKQKDIFLGQGQAEKKRLVLAADGALQQKLATIERINSVWAEAYTHRKVPAVMMGGAGGKSGGEYGNQDASLFSQAINLMAMKQIGLDLSIPKGAVVK